MVGVSVSGVERVKGNVDRAKMRLKTAQEVGVKRASVLVSRMLREEMTQPARTDSFWGKQGAQGLGLAVRSGHTRASVTGGGQIMRIGDRVMAAVGSPEQHLLDHENGGTFGGKSPRGFHRIPTREAQTAAGVDRYAGASIRDIPGSFLLRSLGGKLWAAVRAGGAKSQRVRLLYLLVRSITLKPRKIFARVSAKAAPQVVGGMRLEVAQVVAEANR